MEEGGLRCGCLVLGWRHCQSSAPPKSRLSRCERGSKNREKARSRVAHICQRATDLRTDFLQKLSTQLIHKNQVIMVETLGTKNLLKNRRLAISYAVFCVIEHMFRGPSKPPAFRAF